MPPVKLRASTILNEYGKAQSELIGKTVVLTDGKAGTVENVWLDELHGLRISIKGHELRTPLNAIIGYSEILFEDAQSAGRESETADLRKIQDAGKHLLGLIDNILDLSKIEAGKMTLYLETFELRPMLPMPPSSMAQLSPDRRSPPT